MRSEETLALFGLLLVAIAGCGPTTAPPAQPVSDASQSPSAPHPASGCIPPSAHQALQWMQAHPDPSSTLQVDSETYQQSVTPTELAQWLGIASASVAGIEHAYQIHGSHGALGPRHLVWSGDTTAQLPALTLSVRSHPPAVWLRRFPPMGVAASAVRRDQMAAALTFAPWDPEALPLSLANGIRQILSGRSVAISISYGVENGSVAARRTFASAFASMNPLHLARQISCGPTTSSLHTSYWQLQPTGLRSRPLPWAAGAGGIIFGLAPPHTLVFEYGNPVHIQQSFMFPGLTIAPMRR